MAERGRFELPIGLPLCRISSAVHSTTLPPLREMFQSGTWAKCAWHPLKEPVVNHPIHSRCWPNSMRAGSGQVILSIRSHFQPMIPASLARLAAGPPTGPLMARPILQEGCSVCRQEIWTDQSALSLALQRTETSRRRLAPIVFFGGWGRNKANQCGMNIARNLPNYTARTKKDLSFLTIDQNWNVNIK